MTQPGLSPTAAQPACRTAAGWAPFRLGWVDASGSDAPRFIDHFSTAALSALPPGSGSEAFFTDARGQVLALTTILRTETGLLVATPPGRAETLRDHLEHYHIREAVALRDASDDLSAFLVVGPTAAAAVERLSGYLPPAVPLAHGLAVVGTVATRIIRVSGQGADGYWIVTAAADAAAVAAELSASLPQADQADLEALRLEARYPAAVDIPPKTLPQELGRDARAISFTKGCYLGQETVARLDALGHVNRRLVLLAIDAAEPPPVPVAVHAGGVDVGTLSSACHSPLVGGPAGLALVQVKALAAGGLRVGAAAARVVNERSNSELIGEGERR